MNESDEIKVRVAYYKALLKSWYSNLYMIEKILPKNLKAQEHKLTNIQAVTYSDKVRTSNGIDESMRRSIINDKMNEIKSSIKTIEKQISLCQSLCERLDFPYKDMFEMKYRLDLSDTAISHKIHGYSPDSIKQVITQQLTKLAKEDSQQ